LSNDEEQLTIEELSSDISYATNRILFPSEYPNIDSFLLISRLVHVLEDVHELEVQFLYLTRQSKVATLMYPIQ